MSEPKSKAQLAAKRDLKTVCHAANDGECIWKHCPQLRDKEPEKSGRSCPLHWSEEDEV